MKNWNKKQVSKETVAALNARYGIGALKASILARRGFTEGGDVLYFMEENARYMHNPFLFANMEDVVDRILQARDEGEKVLIFGDKDVDGITSTTVLYDYLSSIGIDVRFRLPVGTDPYGLNRNAVDDFEKEYGTLIITVDCGISNVDEIAYAATKGMDAIVLDHHNPPKVLPEAIIIDPKCEDSGYPFRDISGCAVAYKVVSALRFAMSDLYKNEVALLNVREENGKFFVDAMKTQNLVEKASMTEEILPGTPISSTRLPSFLTGQQIFAWDAEGTKKTLEGLFGSSIDFNMFDFRSEVSKTWRGMADATLEDLRKKSKIALYNEEFDTEIRTFFNIFVTYIQNLVATKFPGNARADERDLQLVALAALADIMPLVDENRIFVRRGIGSMNAGHAREGLLELLSINNLLMKKITSTDLSWSINPTLNATGRLGRADIGISLLLEKDPLRRQKIANEIVEMNEERKRLGSEAWEYASGTARKSVEDHSGKLCVILDDRINRGVSGTLAAKLVQTYNVPSIAMTTVEGTVIGSMRSCRGFDVTTFLSAMNREGATEGRDGLFISYGGHNYAAGFSFPKERIGEFDRAVEKLLPLIVLGGDESETFDVDAEIPERYLTADLLDLVDDFEPYGEANRELLFMSLGVRIGDLQIIGKEGQHLKITLDCGRTKWAALFWNGAERVHRDFDRGDRVDILYTVERNTFNGSVTAQMKIKDIKRSEA